MTSSVHQLIGVFEKTELVSVEFTMDDAKECILNMTSKLDHGGNTIRRIPENWHTKPVFVLETDLTAHFLFSAKETLKKAQKELYKAEAEENKMLTDTIEAKKDGANYKLPDNYWEPRYKAFLKFEAAKRVVQALETEVITTKF